MAYYKIPVSPHLSDTIAPQNLTQREVEILLALYNGVTQSELAVMLNLSRNTVKNHLANINSKVGVNSTIGALQWYIDQVLLSEYSKSFIDIATIKEE